MAQDQEEKIFADGFVFKRNEKAPDFVIGRMSIKVDDAIAFLKQHEENGWVNLSTKQARSGNYYVELDTFKPNNDSAVSNQKSKAPEPEQVPNEPEGGDPDLPF
jgi:hypothetical protein